MTTNTTAPHSPRRQAQMEAFARLLDVLDELRVKCPWDRVQTNQTLRPNTIEETYELCDALLKEDQQEICKELGDVLLHVAFYAKIGEEKGAFDMADVCHRICDKLIYRHPHVFGQEQAETAEKVCENWEQLKLKEKGGNKRVLSGVPQALPSVVKAYRIQEKAQNVGFDWPEPSGVWDKVEEEIKEFKEVATNGTPERKTEEMGDLLFTLINAARLYHIHPDNALDEANSKFIKRFNHMEESILAEGKIFKACTAQELDAYWEKAKKATGNE